MFTGNGVRIPVGGTNRRPDRAIEDRLARLERLVEDLVRGNRGGINGDVGNLAVGGPEPAADHADDGGTEVVNANGPAGPAPAGQGLGGGGQGDEELALAGDDGAKAEELLAESKKQGAAALSAILGRALRRHLGDGRTMIAGNLFDDSEIAELTRAFEATLATADLLGRARVHELADEGQALGQQQAVRFAEWYDEGKWVQIGAHDGEGGSPVFIKDGRIQKGAAALAGKTIKGLKTPASHPESKPAPSNAPGPSKPPEKTAPKAPEPPASSAGPRVVDDRTPEEKAAAAKAKKAQKKAASREQAKATLEAKKQQAAQEKQEWEDEARAAGVEPEEMHSLADDILASDAELKKERSEMLRAARTASVKLGHGSLDAIAFRAGRGEDQDAIKGLDDVAHAMAASYPGQFHGGDDQAQLFDYLVEGIPAPMPRSEAYKQAIDVLYDRNKRRGSATGGNDDVPFSEVGGSAIGPFTSGPRRSFVRFDEEGKIKPFPPAKALAYFRKLVPSMRVTPERFGPENQRRAFTLAGRTSLTIRGLVQKAIADTLAEGNVPKGEALVKSLLERVGASRKNPQYAEMVFRTNMIDAYQKGAQEELQHPEVLPDFPAWQWVAINDNRLRDRHRKLAFDEQGRPRYYPSSVTFQQVRDHHGYDGYNDRCNFRPIHKSEWARLAARGAQFSRFSEGRLETFGVRDWFATARALPQRVLDAAIAKVRSHYATLEQRYGRAYAIAVITAAILGTAIPLPGTTALAAAAVSAVAEIHKSLAGWQANAEQVRRVPFKLGEERAQAILSKRLEKRAGFVSMMEAAQPRG